MELNITNYANQLLESTHIPTVMYPQRISYSFMISICNEVRYYFLTELNITEYFSNTYLLTYSFIISLCNEVRYYFLTELNITVFLNTYLLTYLQFHDFIMQ
jgi:hypothetical protein